MPSEYIKNHPAYRYAKAIVSGDFTSMAIIPEIKDIYKPPTYVIKQCRDFLQVADGKILISASMSTNAGRLTGF